MFKRQASPEVLPQSESRPALPAPAATYFDQSSAFSGSLKLQKNVHIDGSIDGELECAATVTIGPGGKVTASIKAESVVIDGEVHGDIEARTEITLRKSARVYGDLRTEGIVIERGAKVEGQITIGPSTSVAPTLAVPKPSPSGSGA